MTIENQVTSLELSKKLKELRVEQKSLFYWARTVLDGKDFSLYCSEQVDFIDGTERVYIDSGSEGDYWDIKDVYSAFTVVELLEKLDCFVSLSRGSHGYIATVPFLSVAQSAETIDFNPANCLAKLYLKREGLLEKDK